MKVILKKDMDKLGRFGNCIKVADGYARNYLIPQGIAIAATEAGIRQIDNEKAAYEKKALQKKESALKTKESIEAVSLAFRRKTGEDDKLFGSVTVHDIQEGLKARGFDLEKKDVLLNEPIKSIGRHTVEIRLDHEVVALLNVDVEKE
jgi:large subunit ribosomal protein L9